MKKTIFGGITDDDGNHDESTANGVGLRVCFTQTHAIANPYHCQAESTANDVSLLGFPRAPLRRCLSCEKNLSQQPMAWVCGDGPTPLLAQKGPCNESTNRTETFRLRARSIRRASYI